MMIYSIVLSQCLISLGILGFLWVGPVARLRRDNFRSEIRRIRDDLFDFMYKNRYDFSNQAYQTTRQMLNGMIRGSNYFSIITFIQAFAIVARNGKKSSLLIDEIEMLPKGDLKNELKRVTKLAMNEMLKFIFFKRISSLLLIVLLVIPYVVYTTCSWLKTKGAVWKNRFIERPANRLLEEAYVIGSPNR